MDARAAGNELKTSDKTKFAPAHRTLWQKGRAPNSGRPALTLASYYLIACRKVDYSVEFPDSVLPENFSMRSILSALCNSKDLIVDSCSNKSSTSFFSPIPSSLSRHCYSLTRLSFRLHVIIYSSSAIISLLISNSPFSCITSSVNSPS